jgi:glucose-specific phosphotransferase system IIA component
VLSPVSGRSLAVSDVPDPVFASGLVGPGVAIDPEAGPQTAVAPVAGRLVRLLPHAFLIRTAPGPAILVHLGIDTVQLQGAGFTLHASQDDDVPAGAKIVSWDPDAVVRGGRSPVCAVILLDCDAPLTFLADGTVRAGRPVFSVDC